MAMALAFVDYDALPSVCSPLEPECLGCDDGVYEVVVKHGACRLQACEHAYVVVTDEKCALAVVATPMESAPQTEMALRTSPNHRLWISADQVEIDTLFSIPALAEVVESEIAIPPRQVWRKKLVRKLKVDPITREESCRSRLVCVGPRHEQGHGFDRREVPKPLCGQPFSFS